MIMVVGEKGMKNSGVQRSEKMQKAEDEEYTTVE